MISSDLVVIGVDPGKMTGVKTYARGPSFDTVLGHDQITTEQVPAYMNTVVRYWADLIGPEHVHLSVEKFIITKRTAQLSQQAEALEITGMVKCVAALAKGPLGEVSVHQLMKANLKFASDDMLRSVGWYVPGKRHANDAARQAFALLKIIDYPHWADLVRDAKLKAEDEGMRTQ